MATSLRRRSPPPPISISTIIIIITRIIDSAVVIFFQSSSIRLVNLQIGDLPGEFNQPILRLLDYLINGSNIWI